MDAEIIATQSMGFGHKATTNHTASVIHGRKLKMKPRKYKWPHARVTTWTQKNKATWLHVEPGLQYEPKRAKQLGYMLSPGYNMNPKEQGKLATQWAGITWGTLKEQGNLATHWAGVIRGTQKNKTTWPHIEPGLQEEPTRTRQFGHTLSPGISSPWERERCILQYAMSQVTCWHRGAPSKLHCEGRTPSTQ
jgi:hypothetical protein